MCRAVTVIPMAVGRLTLLTLMLKPIARVTVTVLCCRQLKFKGQMLQTTRPSQHVGIVAARPCGKHSARFKRLKLPMVRGESFNKVVKEASIITIPYGRG